MTWRHYCQKHGEFLSPSCWTDAACPQCGVERRSPAPLSDLEREVVEAAKALCRTPYWRESGHFVDLKAAVDRLTAPQPVRPEDVEPGTRFRFADESVRGEGKEFLLVGVDWGKRFVNSHGVAAHFLPGDRIIPIKDSPQ